MNVQPKRRRSPRSVLRNLAPYVDITVLFTANSLRSSDVFAGLVKKVFGITDTTEPESTRNFKLFFFI